MRADSIPVEATGRNAGARCRQADEKVAGMGLAYLPVIEILKLQPWWPELCARVSGLRHLKPLDYIKLSERSSETAHV